MGKTDVLPLQRVCKLRRAVIGIRLASLARHDAICSPVFARAHLFFRQITIHNNKKALYNYIYRIMLKYFSMYTHIKKRGKT